MSFSPRVQQIIAEYEKHREAEYLAHETDLEFLRRTRPDMDEGQYVAYMFFCIIAGTTVRKAEADRIAKEQEEASQ